MKPNETQDPALTNIESTKSKQNKDQASPDDTLTVAAETSQVQDIRVMEFVKDDFEANDAQKSVTKRKDHCGNGIK